MRYKVYVNVGKEQNLIVARFTSLGDAYIFCKAAANGAGNDVEYTIAENEKITHRFSNRQG
jgi:hypothetical protein